MLSSISRCRVALPLSVLIQLFSVSHAFFTPAIQSFDEYNYSNQDNSQPSFLSKIDRDSTKYAAVCTSTASRSESLSQRDRFTRCWSSSKESSSDFTAAQDSNHPKLCRVKLQQFHHIWDYFIPPIAHQDTSSFSIFDHFHPRFVLRESLLGIRLTLRLIGLLTLASWGSEYLGRLVSTNLAVLGGEIPLWISAIPRNQLSMPNLLHFAQQITLAGVLAAVRLPQIIEDEEFSLLRHSVVSPITEELVFRGIGIPLLYWFDWLSLAAWATIFGHLAPTLSYILVMGNVVLKLLWEKQLGGGFPLLLQIKYLADTIIPMWMRIWHQGILIRNKSNQHHTPSSALDASSKSISTDETVEKIQKTSRIVQFATRGQGMSKDKERKLGAQIHRYLLWVARWRSSAFFASSHIPLRLPGGGVVAAKEHYFFLCKFLGTFLSSFWLEGRLVVSRGTLWGAIGAHVTFNTIIPLRVRLEALILPMYIPGVTFARSATVGVGVVGLCILLHKILDRIVDFVEDIEKKAA